MNSVDVPAKKSAGFSKLTVESSGELMKNHEAAAILDAGNRIDVAQDRDGNPIIFSIGNDGEFYMVFRDPATHTGWNKRDLSGWLGKDLEATAFGIYQNELQKIMISVSVCPKGKTDDCTIYITPYLEKPPTLWDQADVAFKKRPFTQGKIDVTSISIGADHEGSSTPLVIAAVTQDSQARHWQVNGDYSTDVWSMQEFLLPENAQDHLLDIAIGQVDGRQGVYSLYTTSTGKSLSFTSLPFKVPHVNKSQTLNYTYNLPGNINQIEALPTSGDSYDIYGAGAGVHRWTGSQRNSQLIAANVKAVSQLVVRQDQDHIAIWMVEGDENLKYVHGPRGRSPQWSVPMTLGTSVTQIAALRNSALQANELFTVKADKSLTYYYQDPTTTLWKEAHIPIPALKGCVDFDSYTTHVQVWEDGEIPLLSKELSLTASQWCYVTVNHQLHIIGPDSPATITADPTGAITVINRVDSMSSPVFHLTAEWLDGIVDIDPSANAQAKLHAIKSGDDLRAVRLPDGSKLIADSIPNDQVDAVGQAIGQLNQVAGKLPAAGGTVTNRASVSTPTNRLVVRGAVANTKFGLVQVGNTHQFVADSSAGSVLSEWGNAVESTAGDVLRWLEHTAEEAVEFVINVVEDTAEFIVKIGKQVLKFVVDTAEAVYRAASWLLKKIAVTFKDLIKWLGHIFGWDDIKQTHDGLKTMFNSTIEFIVDEITEGEVKTKSFFETMKQQIVGKDLAKQLGENATVPISGLGKHNNSDPNRSDPRTNFANYHLQSPAARNADDGADDSPLAHLGKQLLADLAQLGGAEVKTLENAFEEITANLKDKSVGESLETIMKIVSATVIQEIENGVLTLMEVTKLFLEAIEALVNAEWYIPVLSELYETFVGEKLTILNLMTLVLAIPVTVVYKITTGISPLAADQISRIPELFISTPAVNPEAKSVGAAVTTNSSSPSDGPNSLEIGMSFLFGGLVVGAGRLVGSVLTQVIAGDENLSWRWKAAKATTSWITYGAGAGNRALAVSASDVDMSKWQNRYESGMVYAQVVFSIIDTLAIIPKAGRPMAYLKASCGLLDLLALVILFIGEMAGEDSEGDDGWKLFENLGLGLMQVCGPGIKIAKDDFPEAEVVVEPLYAFASLVAVFTNGGRALDAFTKNKTFAPI